jgi:hypothetical protein
MVWRKRALRLGAIASLSAMGFFAAVSAQTSQADLTLPGAEARLGWGGGFSAGAWNELRLTVTGGDAYTLNLETNEGSLRSGLYPVRATLSVAAGAGVREERLLLPLFMKRGVVLTLSSEAFGKKSVTLQPLSDIAEVTEPAASPAAYLGGAKLIGNLEVGEALTALAGGATVADSVTLRRLPAGALGLGSLQRGPFPPSRNLELVQLQNIVSALKIAADAPARRSDALALWSAAAFIVVLMLYSARRLDWRFSVAGAVLASAIGAIGFVSLQVTAPYQERSQSVLIGAGGWGLKLLLHNRFTASGGAQELPAGVQTLEPIARRYTENATLLSATPWSRFSYWEAPKAARVPLRVSASWIENTGSAKLTDLFVVGRGALEGLPVARRELGAVTADLAAAYPPTQYDELARFLPNGTAVARVGEGEYATLVIALPEQP